MGAPRALALCFNFGGAVEFQAGNWRLAETSLRDAVELYRQVGSASGESLSLQRLGVLLTARGVLEEGRQCLEDGIVVAERAAMRSHCLTRLHASMIRNRLAAGDEDGLRISLAEGQEAARRHGKCVTCNALLLPETIRAHLVLGNVHAASECLDRLVSTASQFESKAWSAMAKQAQARLRLARGDRTGARTYFAEAAAAFEIAGQPYEVARCQWGQAQCESDLAEAQRFEQMARQRFEALGASGREDAFGRPNARFHG